MLDLPLVGKASSVLMKAMVYLPCVAIFINTWLLDYVLCQGATCRFVHTQMLDLPLMVKASSVLMKTMVYLPCVDIFMKTGLVARLHIMPGC